MGRDWSGAGLLRLVLGFAIAMLGGFTLIMYAVAVWTFTTGGEYWALAFLGIVMAIAMTAATIGLVMLRRSWGDA